MKKLAILICLLMPAIAQAQNDRGTHDGTVNNTHTIHGWLKLGKGLINPAKWRDSLYLKDYYHRQGGNAYGKADTIGSTDAQPVRIITNGSNRYEIAAAGAHTVTGGTDEASVYVKQTGRVGATILGVGAGSTFTNNFPFIAFSSTGAHGPGNPSITTNGQSLLIAAPQDIQFRGTTPAPPVLTMATAQSKMWRIASGALYTGGGTVNQNTEFFTVFYTDSDNANISWNTGTNYFYSAIATPRVNTSGSYAGDIAGWVFRPDHVAATAGTLYKAFVALNSSGYSLYSLHSDVKLYNGGQIESGSSIKTIQPSVNGAGAWKLGKKITATVSLVTTEYIEVDIDGVVYKLALVN